MTKSIVITPVKTKDNDKVLSVPTCVHIELTSKCNLKCRHCYNFWRHDDYSDYSIKKFELDYILDELIENNVFHVILTGGEPFLNFDMLLYAFKKLKNTNLSVSCNSNLTLATPEKIRKLKDAGLEHILSTINSYDKSTNEKMVSRSGIHEKIIKGIKTTIENGIRVSVNMIITQLNKNQVYETGKLAYNLGAKKFNATRAVPSVTQDVEKQNEFWINKQDTKIVLKDLSRVKKDFGIDVGSLLPYPYCFVGNALNQNINELFYHIGTTNKGMIYTHGCPAGSKMMSLNANGNAHACVHEAESYGNIYKEGLKGVWNNMSKWRTGEIFPEDCKQCEFFDECNAGCRIIANEFTKCDKGDDNLKIGWGKEVTGRQDIELPTDTFIVPEQLRFRKEDGFYVISVFGANVVAVEKYLAEFLLKYQKRGDRFSIKEFGRDKSTLRELLDLDLIKIADKGDCYE